MEEDRSYANLIAREPNDPPTAYRWIKQQKEFAVNMTGAMLELTEHWKQVKSNFSDIAPKPRAELRVMTSRVGMRLTSRKRERVVCEAGAYTWKQSLGGNLASSKRVRADRNFAGGTTCT